MRNFLSALIAIMFAAWIGMTFALALMDTSFIEWIGEFQQYYFTKGE